MQCGGGLVAEGLDVFPDMERTSAVIFLSRRQRSALDSGEIGVWPMGGAMVIFLAWAMAIFTEVFDVPCTRGVSE